MPVKFVICAPNGKPATINSHGELVVGKADHSTPFNVTRSSAGVTNVVPLMTNNRFILTYLVVASDKTNVETQVYVYETLADTGDNTTSEAMILQGSLNKSDRVIMPSLDLVTLSSRNINVETDTNAVISFVIMGYYEQNGEI